MSSNGLPPDRPKHIPVSPPAPLPSSRRRVLDGTECSKSDAVTDLVTLSMLGMTTDFSMLGLLDSTTNQNENRE
jgi:hypothetical protein